MLNLSDSHSTHWLCRIVVSCFALVTACQREDGLPTASTPESSGGNSSIDALPTDGSGTTAPSTMDEPTAATGEEATSDPSTTGSPTSGTTGSATDYCSGFEVDAPAPFLELYDGLGNELADGVNLPLECGGQGLWMFALYPRFGGYEPMSLAVSFIVMVEVEGYNINPFGHFYDGSPGYWLGCEDVVGVVNGVVAIFPPDELADLSVLDGLPAKVHVETDAGGQTLSFDATMPLTVSKELLDQDCP